MKTKNLLILVGLAFLVFSCATVPKPSSQGFQPPDPAFLTNDSEDPYAIPIPLSIIQALMIESAIEKFQQGLMDSHGPLLSTVEPSALDDTVRKFQHDLRDSHGPLLSTVEP